MKYEIIGGSFPAAVVELDAGEEVFTQSGAMAWSDKDVSMSTNAEGGFFKSLGRMFSGTSLMFVTHKSEREDAHVTFSAAFPGTIKAFEVDENHEYIAQKNAFLVADKGVNVDVVANDNIWAGIFGGEGIFLQKFTGKGTILTEIDGSVVEVELKEGEQIKVETGHVAVFESSVQYNIESVKGAKNIFFGGQGLFMTTLTGPGKVWLQTLTIADVVQRMQPYLPSSSSTTVSSSSSSSND